MCHVSGSLSVGRGEGAGVTGVDKGHKSLVIVFRREHACLNTYRKRVLPVYLVSCWHHRQQPSLVPTKGVSAGFNCYFSLTGVEGNKELTNYTTRKRALACTNHRMDGSQVGCQAGEEQRAEANNRAHACCEGQKGYSELKEKRTLRSPIVDHLARGESVVLVQAMSRTLSRSNDEQHDTISIRCEKNSWRMFSGYMYIRQCIAFNEHAGGVQPRLRAHGHT